MNILRIRTGAVRQYRSGEWTSAIAKLPIAGEATVTVRGIVGDEQADLVHHGGPDKAILCYPREHFKHWQSAFGDGAPLPGTLGENFETEGVTEDAVCIGDIFRIGGVEVEVSQPRQPCWKPARLHGLPHLTASILETGRTGWYLRVLTPGSLTAPEPLRLLARPNPQWTVARATHVRHFDKTPVLRAELAAIASLSQSWRDALAARA